MSDMTMRVGDVIHTKSLNVVSESEHTTLSVTFKPPRGKRFVLLALGVDSYDEAIDPIEALRCLGYTSTAKPYAYEVRNALGELELIYAQAATAEDLERPHAPLYR